jgi:cysteine desulfurase
VNGYDLVSYLSAKGICASSSSACASATGKPSHVLTAMGCSAERARGALRFSLNRFNTMEEIDRICEILPRAVQLLRKQNPTYVKQKGGRTDE